MRMDTIGLSINPESFLSYLRAEIPKYAEVLSTSQDWEVIKDIIYFNSSYEKFNLRDQFMIERFLKLPNDQRYLGFFGTNHTRLDQPKKLAGLIISQKAFENNVLVINLHHENSFYRADKPVNYSFLNDVGFFKKKYIKEYLAYYNSLSNCEQFMSDIPTDTKAFKALDKMCDYIIFVRNQTGYTRPKKKEF